MHFKVLVQLVMQWLALSTRSKEVLGSVLGQGILNECNEL